VKNHQLFSSHCQVTKVTKKLVDLEAVEPEVHDLQTKKNITWKTIGIRTIFLRQLEIPGFRGFQLMEINFATAVFQAHPFFHWMMIPSLCLTNAWKSPD